MPIVPDKDDRAPGWVRPAVVALVVAGTVLRLRQYAAARSLWLDEASLALNIVSRSFGALASHLDFEQVAPVPFLWSVRFSALLFGDGERALRLVPLLAGVATLPVLWPVARRALGARWGVAAIALAAMSPLLVYYSNELKQYSSDALLCAALLALTVHTLDAPDSRRRWATLIVIGTIGVASSLTTMLVLPGVVAALALGLVRRHSPVAIPLLGLAVALWSAASGLAYWQADVAGASSPYLRRFWAGSFLWSGEERGFAHAWQVIVDALQQDLVGVASLARWHPGWQVGIALVLALAGAVTLARSSPESLLLAAAPIVSALVASAVGRYPLSARTITFTLPCWCLLLVAGVKAMAGITRQARVPVAVAGLALLLGTPAVVSVQRAIDPGRREDARPVIAQLELRRERGEPVYVSPRALPVWLFYTTDWRRPDPARFNLYRDAIALNDEPSARGRGLTWKDLGGTEILGLPTGADFRPHTTGTARPAVTWASAEARRIRDTISRPPSAWVFFTHDIDHGEAALREALRGEGLTVFDELSASATSAFHVRLQ